MGFFDGWNFGGGDSGATAQPAGILGLLYGGANPGVTDPSPSTGDFLTNMASVPSLRSAASQNGGAADGVLAALGGGIPFYPGADANPLSAAPLPAPRPTRSVWDGADPLNASTLAAPDPRLFQMQPWETTAPPAQPGTAAPPLGPVVNIPAQPPIFSAGDAPIDVSAQRRDNDSPAQAAVAAQLASSAAPASPFGDRVGAALGGLMNGTTLTNRLGSALEGLATGHRADDRGMLEEALVGRGVSPQLARAAAASPLLMQSMVPAMFGNKLQPVEIGSDARGHKVMGMFNPVAGQYYDVAGTPIDQTTPGGGVAAAALSQLPPLAARYVNGSMPDRNGYAPPGRQQRQSGTAPVQLPRVASPAEASALPRGTHFLDPNGVERVVP